jgi:uncharacterized protein (DUF2141 family)
LTAVPEHKIYSLTVHVSGFENNVGKSYIGLYRETDDWPVKDKQFNGKITPINGKKVKVIFDKLPQGNYAVAVFHDKNNNGILDKNLLGIPTERYGFSNNSRETFSAPAFKSAAVYLNKNIDIEVVIK